MPFVCARAPLAAVALLLLSAAPVAAQDAGLTRPVDTVGSTATAAATPTILTADATDGQNVSAGLGMPMPHTVDPDDGLSLALGGSHWQGDFGTPFNSRVEVVFASLRYRVKDIRFTATLPWMRIQSRGALFTGIDATPIIVGDLPASRRIRDGLGDLTLGAAWLAQDEATNFANVELSGRVKLPTASDSSGLSTGKADFAASAELSRTLGPITPAVRVGYRFLGDLRGYKLRDGFTASASVATIFLGTAAAVVGYDYTQRASRFVRDAHELSFGVSAPLLNQVRLSAYASAGLSSGAAAYSTGLSLAFNFGRRATR